MQKAIDTGAKAAPLVMWQGQVLPGWIDYNGHMTESRYYFLQLGNRGQLPADDRRGDGLRRGGHSYYSAETHIRHLGEAKLGDQIRGELQILSADEKRFRSFVRIMQGDTCVATVEQLCLHVDMKAGKTVPAAPEVWAKLQAVARPMPGCRCPKARAAPSARRRNKAMDFGLTEEQAMIVETTRAFVETELYPHEQMVERTGHLPLELIREIQKKAMAAGLYAANMPVEVGGAGLDTLSWLLYEKELGRANYALHWTCVARPSNILLAGNAEQRERYLMPCIRGETWDCLAMTEPGAGSDLRGMKAAPGRMAATGC
jgi:acyl-CoA thioesterase FadM